MIIYDLGTDPTEFAGIDEGPWVLYIYGDDGYHSGGQWFDTTVKYPDEAISFEAARELANKAMAEGHEVRVCNGGDELVFWFKNGVMPHGSTFWVTVSNRG